MGPRALGTVLRIKGGLLGLRLVPIVPAFRFYMSIHKAIDEHGFGMVPPRPPQIKCIFIGVPGQATVDKYQSVLPLLFGGGRREVAIILGKDLTRLKNGRGPTEYKVHRTFNIAVFIILPGTVPLQVQGILKAQKTAVFKDHLIRTDTDGHRLPDLPSIPGTVFKADVPGPEPLPEYKEGRGSRGAQGFPKGVG